ncbi:MAG: hypothetical protein A2Y97_09200 [Nitrospirae bacterium RBG_13_39_12]|nr:MAG: hypothetical protein A2Y97_09200 [Nitrospirae bacterium RBG_13_39_12]
MSKKEEFKILVDKILNENAQTGTIKDEILLSTTNVLQMLTNLDQQIEEQKEYINSLGKKVKALEGNFKTLIKSLVASGYINLGERRKLMKRNILTQEALVILLRKKRVISSKDLITEIKRLKTDKLKE